MGGIVDPRTGEVVWTLHVPVVAQVEHYRAHPPRCLDGLRTTPIDVDWRFDGHGEPVNSVFELACKCGGTQFVAMCYADSDDMVCSPISLHCDACEAVYEIFDSGTHGYDGEAGDLPGDDGEGPYDLETNEVDEPFEAVVRFEYPSDHLGDPQWAGREQQLYSWFTLLARDPTTKKLEQLYDFECA